MIRKFFRFLFLFVLLLIALAAWLAFDGDRQLLSPLNITTDDTLTITPGMRIRGVVLALRDQDRLSSLRQGLYLEAYARASGKAAKIKTGEYRLDRGMSAYQALDLWVSGKVVTYELRWVEGIRFDAALQQLIAHPQIKHTLPGADSAQIMAAIGHAGQHPEGRFFPDTYVFPRDTTDVSILRRAYDAMSQALNTEWGNKAPNLPYASPDDALIMASIVEKETGLASERPQIAGVFVRRLQMGMRLQTDPTVIYGVGALFDGNLRKRDLLAPNPYNTYLNTGLPPTPICLMGRASLNAALHPADGKTLYFVARGDGSHQFSETLEEHEAAVRRFQLHQGGPPVDAGAATPHTDAPDAPPSPAAEVPTTPASAPEPQSGPPAP